MKRTLLAVITLVLLVSGALFAQGPNRFSTKEACTAALKAEQAEIYNPTYMKAHHEPGSGQEVRPLPDFACVHMMTVGGMAWVAQEKGTPFIFEGEVPLARYDCGNKTDDIEYVPLEPPSPPTPSAPPTLVEFPPLEQVKPGLQLTLIKPRFCETDRDGWRPDRLLMGMVDKVRCHPGSMILDAGIAYGVSYLPHVGGGHEHIKFKPKPPHPPHPPKPPIPCMHGCKLPVKPPVPIDRSPL